MNLKQLKQQLEHWKYRRSKYIAEHLEPDKQRLQDFNRLIDQIYEMILNQALKEYKERLYEKPQR